MAPNKAFSAQRAAKATRLFQAFDADSSGDLDLEEFTMLCQVAAPEMDVAAVKASLGGADIHKHTLLCNLHYYKRLQRASASSLYRSTYIYRRPTYKSIHPGIAGRLSLTQFHRWCHEMFHDFTEDEYEAAIDMMLEVRPKARLKNVSEYHPEGRLVALFEAQKGYIEVQKGLLAGMEYTEEHAAKARLQAIEVPPN